MLFVRGHDTSVEAKHLASAGISATTKRIDSQDITVITVDPRDSSKARQIFSRVTDLRGTIIAEDEAAYEYCHACSAHLELGAKWCPDCGIFVGDPHGQ